MTKEQMNNQMIYTIARKRLIELENRKILNKDEFKNAISEIKDRYKPLIPYDDLK